MKDILQIEHEEGEFTINGFINSSGELEFSIYRQVDGGCLAIEDEGLCKEELSDLLYIELKNYITMNK